jgi:Sulfotransferase family
MRASNKTPLLILGAPPRAGNHLLRGLLDHHPQLLLPPDEDYFIRHLARHRLWRWRGMFTGPAAAPAFFRQLQKDGHLERVNAGYSGEAFGTRDSLDLDTYYGYISHKHRRFSVDSLVRNHVEALAAALGHREGDGRLRVIFCALQPSGWDLSRVTALLARSYDIRGIFLVRDPRAHLSSKLARKPTLKLDRFCRLQNRYWQEIERFSENFGSALPLRFEDLVVNTEATMRRVCDFADIDFSEAVLKYTQGGKPARSNSSFADDSGRTGRGASESGIDPEVLTRYRDTLPAETEAYLEKHCLPELFWQQP